VTEIVYALGIGGRVVGVSQFVSYPPEALDKPRCGGFVNPNRERILTLEPDLVIVQGLAQDMTDFATNNGIDLVSVWLTDLESIFSAIMKIGLAVGCEARAGLLCAEMRLALARVKVAVEGKPTPNVFIVLGREPGTLNRLFTSGSHGFLNDLIEIAGGRNIFRDIEREYSAVNREALLDREPDVIIELHGEGMNADKQLPEIRQLWGSLKSLPAVRQRRIYIIEGTYALLPGPRVVQLARELADLFHRKAPE